MSAPTCAFNEESETVPASCDHPADRFVEALCPTCNKAVDAVCPSCGCHVEGTLADAATISDLAKSDFIRRVIGVIQESRNSKYMAGCVLIAIGSTYADGVGLSEYAKQWGVTRATVSKHCRYICEYLKIPPSQYMQTEEVAAVFKRTNRRPSPKKGKP